jgi:thymidylate synthase
MDQLRECLDTIVKNPGSRRILFHGWNCAVLDEIALPACHLLYQFLPNQSTGEISLCLYTCAATTSAWARPSTWPKARRCYLVGRLTGYKPRWFSYFMGDAHIYENHIDMVKEQLTREPSAAATGHRRPRAEFAKTGEYAPQWLELVEPSDFSLELPAPRPLTAPMAV